MAVGEWPCAWLLLSSTPVLCSLDASSLLWRHHNNCPSKTVHVLILGSCVCGCVVGLHAKGNLSCRWSSGCKPADLEMEKSSWIIWMVLISGRQRWRWEKQRDGSVKSTSPAIIGLKDGGSSLGPRNGATSRSLKRPGNRFFPHRCQQECRLANTFIFTQRDSLVTHRKLGINVCCPETLSLFQQL